MVKEDIQFTNGKSKLERGYGNGEAKISYTIAGIQKRSRALYRGDTEIAKQLSQLVTDFLNSDETKEKIIEILQK